MKKQKLSFGLSLVLLLSSSLVVASDRASASPFQSLGTGTESSGYSGDSFINPNVGTPSQPTLVPGVNVEISSNGQFVVPPEVQNTLNQIATDINNEGPAPTLENCLEPVAALLRGGLCQSEGKLQIESILASYKIKPELIAAFIDSVSGLLANNNVDVTRLSSAIKNWNNIVKQFNSNDLPKVVKDPNLAKLTNHLQKLRGALKKAR